MSLDEAARVAEKLSEGFAEVFVRERPKGSGKLQVIARGSKSWAKHQVLRSARTI